VAPKANSHTKSCINTMATVIYSALWATRLIFDPLTGRLLKKNVQYKQLISLLPISLNE